MKMLRVISRLLCYPDADLCAAVPEMRAAVEEEKDHLPRELYRDLDAFLDEVDRTPLLQLQEQYVLLFDRGRVLSLHLFEHVHGESRDRGQAMVDLMNHYHERGYMLAAHELPDYLPLFLEFLSTQQQSEINELLGDAMGVVVLLGARLKERGSPYDVLFDALEAVVGTPEDAADMRRLAANEGPDEAIEKMDEIWEEEQVTFLANNDPSGGGCSAARHDQPAVSPVQWVDHPRTGTAGPAAARGPQE